MLPNSFVLRLALSLTTLVAFLPPRAALAADPVPTPSPSARAASGIEFDRFEKTTFYFRAPPGTPTPKPITTELYEAQYLGSLTPPGGGAPYFLFKGRTCQDCLQDLAIHVLRPGKSPVTSFVYPGRILEPKHRQVVFEGRAFFGRCLASPSGDAYVVFQREHVDKRRGYQSSVFVAEADEDHFDESLIERRPPRIADTLKRVKLKHCKEVDGRNRIALSRPLNLRVMGQDNDDSDDDDDEDGKTDGKTDGKNKDELPSPKAASP